ncbi:MAG: phosphatidic acid phosphatase [Clostridia bacterium]|nr:phosphatidic acid phosphatase [Clostridia bacterium]
MIDYKGFTLSKIKEQQYSHLLLLVFWPIYAIAFYTLELGLPGRIYFPVESVLDAYIPFCEWFFIPYLFWFLYLAGMVVYGCLFDSFAFRRYMYFIMVSYTVTIFIYVLFPTCQNLRPAAFDRDNILTRMIAGFYEYDTNTNVCPSIHVLGSFGVLYGAWHTKHFSTKFWRGTLSLVTVVVSMSTVFMKQHSVIDVFAALVLCVVTIPVCHVLERNALLKSEKIKA